MITSKYSIYEEICTEAGNMIQKQSLQFYFEMPIRQNNLVNN